MSTSRPDHPTDPAPDEAASAGDEPVARVVDAADPATVRRAPRYGRFALAGAVLGALLSLVLAPLGSSGYSLRDVVIVLLIALGPIGTFAGLGVALLLDRRSLRRRGRG
ncbi:hypothetical protein [uncultured Georgenia sp.]|uniref:hypothetical protein n=1 Tax=uncultured Georgenia sp. TaxID=378209 RepID=UPI00263733B1|nr:hypothetical protein [uncultured Georgenia sp.]HLV03342.1 hypothetical protein [Actinomycetaceae bacterium]